MSKIRSNLKVIVRLRFVAKKDKGQMSHTFQDLFFASRRNCGVILKNYQKSILKHYVD